MDAGNIKAFDLLTVAAEFAKRKNLALNSPTFVEEFLADAGPRLKDALGDNPLLYGKRAERLFEATVVSLGRYRLLKAEDSGRVHSTETFRAPDFRIILDDGNQWLVEVKNVHCQDPSVQHTRLSAAYYCSLQTYADVVGTPLRIAIYWSCWSLWTVIDPKRFINADGAINIDMLGALRVNEFGQLGDASILTMHPLRLILDAPGPMLSDGDDQSLLDYLFASAHVFSQDVELDDPRDRHMAILLVIYGEWTLDWRPSTRDAGRNPNVEIVAEPQEPSKAGQAGIGCASRIFARFFASRTVEEGEVIQLNGEAVPDWFVPLSRWHAGDSKLPLAFLCQRVPDNGRSQESAPNTDEP